MVARDGSINIIMVIGILRLMKLSLSKIDSKDPKGDNLVSSEGL